MLNVGDPAPDFDLPDAEMEMVSLASFRGKRHVILYFYPKDDTPGCTLEAIDFSERDDEFRRRGAVVIGISMDDCLSHAAFRDKHGLAVQLLADTEAEVCELYGVLYEKQLDDGRKKRCIQRSTFIIDKQGRLARVLYGVNARGHAAEVLALIKELQ
jgi:thioredoxin-dependent peroxiredoxin